MFFGGEFGVGGNQVGLGQGRGGTGAQGLVELFERLQCVEAHEHGHGFALAFDDDALASVKVWGADSPFSVTP